MNRTLYETCIVNRELLGLKLLISVIIRQCEHSLSNGEHRNSKEDPSISIDSRRLDRGWKGSLVDSKAGKSVRKGERGSPNVLFGSRKYMIRTRKHQLFAQRHRCSLRRGLSDSIRKCFPCMLIFFDTDSSNCKNSWMCKVDVHNMNTLFRQPFWR